MFGKKIYANPAITNLRLVWLLFLSVFMVGCNQMKPAAAAEEVSMFTYRIVHTYPHDPDAFTQGLEYYEGSLYEGTGRYGHSSIRKVDLTTGEVLQIHNLDSKYFGEGITIFNSRLIELTWLSHLGFVYHLADFSPIKTFRYPTEGWGLANDGQRLIMSDGSATLYFLDPESLEITGRIKVTFNDSPVTQLNELEYIRGVVYANVFQTDYIVAIDPRTGRVTRWIDLSGLSDQAGVTFNPEAVLNGIAYDSKTDRMFVTGKLWSKLFQIELVPTE